MNWDHDALRAAALRLLLTRTLHASRTYRALLSQLEELGMVGPTRRAAEFRLRDDREEAFRQYLLPRWPGFPDAEMQFTPHPEMVCAARLRAWRRAALSLSPSIKQMNRKTASAWYGAHSKSGRRTACDDVMLTSDQTLRLRPNAGLVLVTASGQRLALAEWGAAMGEVSIPERALASPWQVGGNLPKVMITVENLGAFVDFKVPPWLLILHAPGWQTSLASRFIDRLPASIPWLHFADLDPNGLRIGLSIRCSLDGRKARPWIPRAAAILLPTHARRLARPWPTRNLPAEMLENSVLRQLVVTQKWLEQESLVLLSEFDEEVGKLPQRLSSGIWRY